MSRDDPDENAPTSPLDVPNPRAITPAASIALLSQTDVIESEPGNGSLDADRAKEKLALEMAYEEVGLTEEPVILGKRPLRVRLWEITVNWLPLGYITFGGPAAHVALMLQLWVHSDDKRWLDAASFAELFSLCQTLPGPASTKLQFAIAIIRTGLFPALYAFLLWGLPGFVVMLGIAYGINAVGSGIPVWMAYVENGLVSVAVGLVALAAYKLARAMYTTDMQIFIGFLSFAFASAFSTTSWIYPVLMAGGGVIMYLWRALERLALEGRVDPKKTVWSNGWSIITGKKPGDAGSSEKNGASSQSSEKQATQLAQDVPPVYLTYSPSTGAVLIATAVLVFVVCIVVRNTSAYDGLPRPVQLFITLFECGVIIFGGGPVVIPLLAGYIVDQGWCTSQEFLIGLAFINCCPGPNFNFAAYLGALALRTSAASLFAGAVIGTAAIFSPGLLLIAGFLPFWHRVRTHSTARIVLDGVNAAAVGLVFAAAYGLWQKAIVPVTRNADGTIVVSSTSRILDVGQVPLYVILAAFGFVSCGVVTKWKIPDPWAVAVGGLVGLVQWAVSVR
ncbi:chromate transporter [Gonapodya prolifera JEL478]|uniref:Chromate transporter n=1 Tax=Gonapodya prolifera (strain JEL478) TaxID=1344416 RepID=A0A139AZX2_GONPJ|nr:chromate transporter [Gonapodya prolifera JEL478]|eukprot:KXS22240.1 chromate transporter [Gonapodya prolifera JEL478]